MNKKRIVFLIDGFNLYHSIVTCLKENRLSNKYKWLNYKKLCQSFLKNQTEEIGEVVLYTAYAHWRSKEAVYRHKKFIQALRYYGVKIVFGNFKEKDRRCPICKEYIKQHEEKETDVNIALDIIDYTLNKDFDGIYIISGDSDLKPAIERAKKYINTSNNLLSKTIKIIFPYKQHTNALKKIVGKENAMGIKKHHIETSLMDEEICIENEKIIKRPEKWQ